MLHRWRGKPRRGHTISKGGWHAAGMCATAEETGNAMLLLRSILSIRGSSAAVILLRKSDADSFCDGTIGLKEDQASVGSCGSWLRWAATPAMSF